MTAQKKPTRNLALKLAIVASGHTARRIALRARIGEVRLSAIVRGRLEASADERRKLAKVLQCDEARLFPTPEEAIAS